MPRPSDIDVGRAVVEAEARALGALGASLGAPFERACDLLAGDRRRVVVTGMGKSGHIGAKIAATLASTGTPAQFVHPAEASHGDLGMITSGDAVLALSFSGDTAELRNLVLYARRFQIPLVAICARAQSMLGRAADALLLLPSEPEACPMGLAPTTSTTMTLALGDALAVALLERRGFGARDFKLFHPGGKLGAQLTTVRDLMRVGDDMPLVGLDAAMSEAIVVMSEKRMGCVAAVDADGRLAGVVTDGDLRRHMGPTLFDRAVGAIMSPEPRTIDGDALAVEALAAMNEGGKPVTVLFVIDAERRPLGALHIHDCLRAGVA